MKRLLWVLLLPSTPAAADILARELPLVIEAPGGQTQYVRFQIKARPSFTFVRGNEEYSNFTTQTVLVKDTKTGDVISTVRQSDISFVDAYIYLPAKYIGPDGQAHLVLQPSSAWIITDEIAAEPVVTISAAPAAADHYQTYEIMFGKPDDQPFLGQNISYAEGAYRTAGWAFNKFFRYGNDPSTFRLPLEAGATVYMKPNFYLSANALFTVDDKEIAIFERSLGSRFFQDFYRTALNVSARPVHDMRVSNVAPFRATPTNLRQMAFAFNSIEIATPRAANAARLNVVALMNTRLDYRQAHDAREALLNPSNAVAELAKHQGGAWLPTRDPIALPTGTRRQIDAVVLLDPILNDLANTSYSTGDVWINAAVGAAMMLEAQGYSVVYATPDDLKRLHPKVVYIASQPFYRNILTQAVFKDLQALGAKTIIDPSFSGEFINNQILEHATGLQFIEAAQFIAHDEVVFYDKTKTDAFQATPVMEYRIADPTAKPEASLAHLGRPIAFTKPMGSGSVSTLAFPAGYYFFNYGLRANMAVVASLLRGAAKPNLTVTSASQVRAYVIRQERCSADVMVENNNFGAFNYYGFAQVNAPKLSATPPPVSRVVLAGALFDGGRKWVVSGTAIESEAADRSLIILDLNKDTVVPLINRSCDDTDS